MFRKSSRFWSGIIAISLCFITSLGGQSSRAAEQLVAETESDIRLLTIEQAIETALYNSRTLKINESEIRARQAAVQEAQSRFLPTLSSGFTTSYMTNPPEGITIPEGSFGTAPTTGSRYPEPLPANDIVLVPDTLNTYFKFTSDLQLPIITWGKLENAVSIANAQFRIAALQLQKDTRQVVRDVRNAYFGSRMAYETSEVLSEMKTMMEDIVSDKRGAFQQGFVTRQDVLEAESRQAGIEYQFIKSKQAYASAMEGLFLLLGAETGSDFTLMSEYRSTLPSIDPELLYAKSVTSSPDRGILTQNIQQAETLIKIEDADSPFRPTLGLNVQLSITGQSIPLTANWTDNWSANLIVSLGTQMGIFDGGYHAARVNQAQERLIQANLGLELTDKSMRVKIRQLVEAVILADAERKEKHSALLLAEEREKNARVAFDNEIITREELQGATIAHMSTRLEHILASFQVEAGITELEYMLGERLE